ncbi:hypothetical protein E2C01_072763 [Portunus trituberculatus]|uniref:Uncharacterized protein n=1 Tax=Portunus trituberculatus TaxID=210409 RepID=A0A5B7IBJ7_PORTR|nr:hypothetical protein [Portunus trituberculatus]
MTRSHKPFASMLGRRCKCWRSVQDGTGGSRHGTGT